MSKSIQEELVEELEEMYQDSLPDDEDEFVLRSIRKVEKRNDPEYSEVQQKPTVTPEHIIAKIIDTLEWKFSHLPDAKKDFASINVSRKELQEIKNFVEVVK